MALDIEQKANQSGEVSFKLMRVMGSDANTGRTMMYILFTIRRAKDNKSAYMSVRAEPIAGSPVKRSTIAGKLNLNKCYTTVDRVERKVQFGPAMFIVEEGLRGFGIGTAMMNELIAWLKAEFPSLDIIPPTLKDDDLSGEEARVRRNRFLENFGFSLNFDDFTQTNGVAEIKSVSDLKEYVNIAKIEELDAEGYILDSLLARQKMEQELRRMQSEMENVDDEYFTKLKRDDVTGIVIVIGVIIALVIALLML